MIAIKIAADYKQMKESEEWRVLSALMYKPIRILLALPDRSLVDGPLCS